MLSGDLSGRKDLDRDAEPFAPFDAFDVHCVHHNLSHDTNHDYWLAEQTQLRSVRKTKELT